MSKVISYSLFAKVNRWTPHYRHDFFRRVLVPYLRAHDYPYVRYSGRFCTYAQWHRLIAQAIAWSS